ncbi:hypothetical protein ONJ87_27605, partial [Salmonella enterica subsp. enterica serovar Anatum]|nr:hypothetical protein [Salmonella enterica subsp. enterica serovar Anatum]
KKSVGAGNAIAVQNLGENSAMLLMLGLYSLVVLVGVPAVAIGVPSMSLRMLGLTFYGVGILSYYGPYWALPSALLSPSGLAISI